MIDSTKNPFLFGEPLKLIHVIESNRSGKLSGKSSHIEYNVEAQRYVRVYRVPFMDNILFKECTASGRDLYLYIQNHLKIDFDFINLKLSKVMKALNIKSTTTFYKAIHELSSVSIISRKSGAGEFWVNPHFIFNGNRVDYWEQNKGKIKMVDRTIIIDGNEPNC